MADDDMDDDVDAEGGEGEGQAGGGGKKKLFIIIGAAVFVLLGAGAGVYFTGLLDPLLGGKKQTVEAAPADTSAPAGPAGPAVFHDLPEMIVTLNTGQRKTAFLKIRVSLVLFRPCQTLFNVSDVHPFSKLQVFRHRFSNNKLTLSDTLNHPVRTFHA